MPSTQSIVLFLVVSLGAITIYWVGRTCVFSAVKAQLILNGKPVLHTKVIRRWEWNSQKSDESITDEQGFVTFPAVFEFSISRFLPIELVIAQGVYIVRDGEEKRSGQIQNVSLAKIQNTAVLDLMLYVNWQMNAF